MNSSLLLEAAKSGDLTQLQHLLGQDPALARTCNEQGVSAVFLALYRGHSAAAGLLLQHGAEHSLLTAAALGDCEQLRQQLSAGTSLNQFSPDGWTALHLAAFLGQAATLQLLLEHRPETNTLSQNALCCTALGAAAARNQLQCVELLLQSGADPDLPQAGGFSPLHLAAHHGFERLALLLLTSGADADRKNDSQQTPLDLALQRGHAGIVEMLWPSETPVN